MNISKWNTSQLMNTSRSNQKPEREAHKKTAPCLYTHEIGCGAVDGAEQSRKRDPAQQKKGNRTMIKLTETRNGKTAYINPAYIQAVTVNQISNRTETVIHMTGTLHITVKESIEKVIAMIAKEGRETK